MRSSLSSVVRSVLLEDMAPRGLRLDVNAGSSGSSGTTGSDADTGAGEPASGMRPDDSPISGVSPKDEEAWRKRVMDFALRFKDVPYAWGGKTPQAFDCSGFVWYVLKNSGLTPLLERARSGDQMKLGSPIQQSQLRYGDLVGFTTADGTPSHIGFYLSGTKYLSALGGDGTTTLARPKFFNNGTKARVMEYDFTTDRRPKYYASLSDLIAKRLKEDEKKGPVASAEQDQQKKGEEKKKA